MRLTQAPGLGCFSVFSIGSGHFQTETNNTIAQLWRECTSPKHVNDGPNSIGWGGDAHLSASVAAIKAARPLSVVLTGHSRGAILCHRIASALKDDLSTKDIIVYMIVLDPVNMEVSEAGRDLDNPNILSYHAIVMTHEESAMFPLYIPNAIQQVSDARHWIKMPGKHGSGTQCLTSAVGMVVKGLIARYMRSHGTTFRIPDETAPEMCELFARIRVDGRIPCSVNMTNYTMTVYDDHHSSTEHTRGGFHNTESRNTMTKRAPAMAAVVKEEGKALTRRSSVARLPSDRLPPGLNFTSYFLNQEHAAYFKQAFPATFSLMSQPSTFNPHWLKQVEQESRVVRSKYALNLSLWPLIEPLVNERWWSFY